MTIDVRFSGSSVTLRVKYIQSEGVTLRRLLQHHLLVRSLIIFEKPIVLKMMIYARLPKS